MLSYAALIQITNASIIFHAQSFVLNLIRSLTIQSKFSKNNTLIIEANVHNSHIAQLVETVQPNDEFAMQEFMHCLMN